MASNVSDMFSDKLIVRELTVALISLLSVGVLCRSPLTDWKHFTIDSQILNRFNFPGIFSPRACDHLKLYDRSIWNGNEPKYVQALNGTVEKIWLDSTPGSPCLSDSYCESLVQALQSFYMDIYGDTPYNFMIGNDARVYVGQGFENLSPARAEIDPESQVMLIGFLGRIPGQWTITPRMFDVAHLVIKCGQEKGILAKNLTIITTIPEEEACQNTIGGKFFDYLSKNRELNVKLQCGSNSNITALNPSEDEWVKFTENGIN